MKKQILRVKPCGSGVVKCENLVKRSALGGTMLGVVPEIEPVIDGDCRPLATRYLRDGRAMILWERTPLGGKKGLWYCNSESPKEFFKVVDDVEPRCAIATSDGFIVMTDSGAITLFEQEDDGTLAVVEGLGTIPEGITIEGIDMGELTSVAAGLTINGVDFSREVELLSRSDLKRLGETLAEAYERLASVALDGGMWLQPVVVRWHLVSNSGERMYSSAPIVVAPSGWQCAESYTVECSKGDSSLIIPPIQIKSHAYRIVLKVSEEASQRFVGSGVASIELDCTPQLHIVDSSAAASVRFTNNGDSGVKMSVMLPGVADYFCSRESVNVSRLELMASGAYEMLQRPLAELHHPISSGETILLPAIKESVRTQQLMVDRAIAKVNLNRMISEDERLRASVARPHGFTASTATVSGATVVWGDVTPILSTRLNVVQMCSDWVSGECVGFVSVTRRDGGVYSANFNLAQTPRRWAASVILPDMEAVGVRVCCQDVAGNIYHGELALHTMADGCHSGLVFSSLEGEMFKHQSGAMPSAPVTAVTQSRRFGAIVMSDIGSPLTALAAAECSQSRIVGLLPAVKSQSSWDFSRCHIYAFTHGGVCAVSLNLSRRVISSSLIDSRGVKDERGVSRTDDAVVMIYRNRLLKLSASHAVDVGGDYDFSQIVHDAAAQRLWFKDEFGGLVLSEPEEGFVSSISLPFDIENIYEADNRLWISDSDALYCIRGDGEPKAPEKLTPIEWKCHVDLPIGERLRFVEFRVSGRRVRGEIEVSELLDASGDSGMELLRFSLDREVKAPIKVRVSAASLPRIEMSIKGDVSEDFCFEDVIIHLV